ncbi:hypothetical protein JTB14_034905 [Gonioctena quinquepunctata]|nr:hypothetical protein JTB14_034905 [Gonioctena quinquepunctata]
MDLLQSKIFSLVALGLSSLFVGVLPNCFARQGRQQWPLLLSSLLCFGGGVLLSTSLLHILPELRESAPEEYKQYAELVFCLGFFILYMLDEIVHYFYGNTHEAAIFHSPIDNNGTTGRRHSTSSKCTYGALERQPLLERRHGQPPYNPSFHRARSDSVLFCDQAPSQLCHVGHQAPCKAAPTANIGLLVALSVHAILEGLVVGLEAMPDKSKIVSLVVLGSSSLFVGVLPNWFARRGRQRWPLLLSCLLCFGGGVLLSTSVLHILPELRKSVPEEYKQYTELVFCLGFFIMYILDEIVHYFYGNTRGSAVFHNNNGTTGRRLSTPSEGTYGALERQPLRETTPGQPPNHGGHQDPCIAAPNANIGLLVALSVHAISEGLVVGLEAKTDKVLLLLGAIASHKLVVSFCLGMELASNPQYIFLRHFVYILIFSLGSSGGILLGMFITNIPSEIQNIMIPILQGLAGGTLLYVTVSEVLPRERARWHQQHEKRGAGLVQFFSVGLGFALMTVLSKFLDYDG